LDIYLPDLKIAIEYNGIYWHSLPKSIIKDQIKQDECKRLGIDLLVINEQDWIDDKDIELNKINSFIMDI